MKLPLALLMTLMVLQVLSAAYFAIDGFEDWVSRANQGFNLDLAMELAVAIALLTGVVLSSSNILSLHRELKSTAQTLARARGALGDHIFVRFRQWGLTRGEAEVALFALKGCDISEIARLRGSATGTIRSQLSQIYAKVGVTSQAMLVSIFLDDLIDVSPASES